MHSSKNRLLPQSSPELSVIVPLLNEAALLPQLFATLQQQQGVVFELLLVDGGSTDQTVELATVLSAAVPFSVHILSTAAGRGGQMNAGVAVATADYFLFLHADSTFMLPDSLQLGLKGLIAAEKGPEDGAVAARFSLSFTPDLPVPYRWRVFHTVKARQNRRGCIHGDQGFLMSRIFFARIGPFDETLPFLEDDRLSDRIFACGRWILLSIEIMTSPRRFVVEGFLRRDFLNMLILALHQTGYEHWLCGLATTYKATPVGKGSLFTPVLGYIKEQLKALPYREQLRFWVAISRCVGNNLWQIRLLMRALIERRGGGGAHPN